MTASGFNWSLMTIVGPLALLAVIAWAILRNRASRESKQRTEEATRRVYEEEERARRDGEDGAS